jgi:hypothetical protein
MAEGDGDSNTGGWPEGWQGSDALGSSGSSRSGLFEAIRERDGSTIE